MDEQIVFANWIYEMWHDVFEGAVSKEHFFKTIMECCPYYHRKIR